MNHHTLRLQIGLLLCLLGILLISCNRKAGAVATAPHPKLGTVDKPEILHRDSFPAVDIQPELEEIPIYLVAELKRSECYGVCPAFNARVYSDGRAEYEGIAHVDKIGKYKATLNGEQLARIYKAAERADYFVLHASYPTNGRMMRDLPLTTSYLKRGGLEKRIHNNFDAPMALLNFEDWLEQFFLQLNWTKVP